MRVSVPSFGDSFFIAVCFFKRPQYKVSVPSFGDSFFIRKARLAMANYNREFPSPHSGILFLWVAQYLCKGRYGAGSFRPLIRGFFFYVKIVEYRREVRPGEFPSPHSGILFLLLSVSLKDHNTKFPSPHSGILFLLSKPHRHLETHGVSGFRPLIRGFFFYCNQQ